MLRRWRTAVVAAGVTAAVCCGIALAAGVQLPFSGDGNTINGCYSSGGALKLLTPSEPTCPKGYSPITWNQTGPQGPAGTNGTPGVIGAQGPVGPSHAYYAQNSHEVEDLQGAFIEVVGLSDLPAGNYVVTTEIANGYYVNQGNYYTGDMSCVIQLNNTSPPTWLGIGAEDIIKSLDTYSDTFARAIPDHSSLIVKCRGNETTLAKARITAIQVEAIN